MTALLHTAGVWMPTRPVNDMPTMAGSARDEPKPLVGEADRRPSQCKRCGPSTHVAKKVVDAKLEKLVGVPCPVLPEAAWLVADQLPEEERIVEYERLAIKYGERNSAANGASTGRRARRETRPMARLGAH